MVTFLWYMWHCLVRDLLRHRVDRRRATTVLSLQWMVTHAVQSIQLAMTVRLDLLSISKEKSLQRFPRSNLHTTSTVTVGLAWSTAAVLTELLLDESVCQTKHARIMACRPELQAGAWPPTVWRACINLQETTARQSVTWYVDHDAAHLLYNTWSNSSVCVCVCVVINACQRLTGSLCVHQTHDHTRLCVRLPVSAAEHRPKCHSIH